MKDVDAKKYGVVLLLAGLIFGGAGSCFAGAWTLSEGKLYNKLSVNSFSANSELDKDGKSSTLANNGKFGDLNLGNYLEYGLSDKWSLVSSFYVKQIEKKDNSQTTTTNGIADVDLGMKYKMLDGESGIMSSQVMFKIPGAYDKNSVLPLGNGQLDVELRLLYGVSLWRILPGYANFEAGYRWRAEAPSDEFRYLAEFGADITKKIYGRVKLDGIKSMKNSDKIVVNSSNITLANEYDVGKLDIAIGYKISDTWGVELGYTPTIYGVNTAKGTTYSLGVTYLTK